MSNCNYVLWMKDLPLHEGAHELLYPDMMLVRLSSCNAGILFLRN